MVESKYMRYPGCVSAPRQGQPRRDNAAVSDASI